MGSKAAPDDGVMCPVLATAQIVSGKWTLVMLRDLAEGPRRFSELQRSLAGISPRTLSIRLRALEDEGIVERAYGARWLAEDCADGQPARRVLEAVGS